MVALAAAAVLALSVLVQLTMMARLAAQVWVV
jgi:hypothetical protein